MGLIVFPNRIREFRKQASLTMLQLGEAVGVTEGYISRIEIGLRAPQPALLAAIANKLQVSVEHLLIDEHTPQHVRDEWIDENSRSARGQAITGVIRAGAALRILRTRADLTLNDVKKIVGLGLSTIHAIETGTREIKATEYPLFAKALGHRKVDSLKKEISKLADSPELITIVARMQTDPGEFDLMMQKRLAMAVDTTKTVGIFGHAKLDGTVIVNRDTAIPQRRIELPSWAGCYGILLGLPIFGDTIPPTAVMVLNPEAPATFGGMALAYERDGKTARFGLIAMEEEGRVILRQPLKSQEFELDEARQDLIHPVVAVIL